MTLIRAGNLGLGFTPGGRLTTESGVPVSSSSRTAQGTLYYTPIAVNGWHGMSDQIELYDGTHWKRYTFTEISLSLTGLLTSGKNYDVFIYDNDGTLTIELSAAWTDDSTRADALALQDGRIVKSGATTRRWVGTIRASATDQIEDSPQNRFLWSAFNQVPMTVADSSGSSHTYNSGTPRTWNGDNSSRASFVVGAPTRLIHLHGIALCTRQNSGGIWLEVYVDGAGDGDTMSEGYPGSGVVNNGNFKWNFSSHTMKSLAPGLHYIEMWEWTNAISSTFSSCKVRGVYLG